MKCIESKIKLHLTVLQVIVLVMGKQFGYCMSIISYLLSTIANSQLCSVKMKIKQILLKSTFRITRW